jgi:putative transposase
VSVRRACRALPVDRSTYHYRSRRAGQAELTARIKEIAATRVRYGFRCIHVLLRREGWRVNPKRVYPLYREMGLQLRNKVPSVGSRQSFARIVGRPCKPTRPGRWTLSMTNLQRDASCASSRSSTPSFGSRRRSNPGSPSGRRRRRGARTDRPCVRIPQGYTGGSRHRVCLSRSGSLGLSPWCDTRLLASRQADRQCVHRILQRQVPSGMPQCALVHEPRRCAPKMRGLAQRL